MWGPDTIYTAAGLSSVTHAPPEAYQPAFGSATRNYTDFIYGSFLLYPLLTKIFRKHSVKELDQCEDNRLYYKRFAKVTKGSDCTE